MTNLSMLNPTLWVGLPSVCNTSCKAKSWTLLSIVVFFSNNSSIIVYYLMLLYNNIVRVDSLVKLKISF